MGEGETVAEVLSEAESANVLDRMILPVWTGGAVSQEKPVVLLVAGPPGSGKSTLGDLLLPVLGLRGGAVRVGADLYKAVHQDYDRLLSQDVRTAGTTVRTDTRRWQAAVEEHVRSRRLDALVETALADADEARAQVGAYRAAGYRVEVVAVACALAWSQLGVLGRYLGEGAGAGRYVSWSNHDECARQLGRTLEVLEAERLVDRITVVRRGTELLYCNELVDGAWSKAPGAARAVEAERARWWSAMETDRFRRSLRQTEHSLVRAETRLPADRLLAVSRDAERAAALAEPVRRTAQVRPGPPGVDYHRLSAAEHRWTFENLIVPGYLDAIRAQEQPVAVYVMGEPGAGKTGASRMVLRAMQPGTVLLSSDVFKAAHPDYFELLLTEARHAGAAIRADYRAWFRQAEAWVRERRGDVVIEIAPGSAAEFLDSAAAFHRAGYRVEVAVLAVREADSRQGCALRYALNQRNGVPSRFTSVAGHRTCFTGTAAAIVAAQGHEAVHTVLVIDRGGHLLAHQENTRTTGGPRAAAALAAGRLRPYTEQEAAAFLHTHAALRRALPQHRDELEDIAALARPLMPAAFQPPRLGQPVGDARALPEPAADYRSVSSASSAV
ncbi:zeta toxin family protein [Streptomyces sp. NRRL B-24484]|uniref:zeta toxin family protein n=1 Tax=Streptomyces sp. NRRL B-24484 TaxID=1463833 RepID=UPI000693E638|nr:zeta toxin family protein [Streptomyces sp. NRRL B-24484]